MAAPEKTKEKKDSSSPSFPALDYNCISKDSEEPKPLQTEQEKANILMHPGNAGNIKQAIVNSVNKKRPAGDSGAIVKETSTAEEKAEKFKAKKKEE